MKRTRAISLSREPHRKHAHAVRARTAAKRDREERNMTASTIIARHLLSVSSSPLSSSSFSGKKKTTNNNDEVNTSSFPKTASSSSRCAEARHRRHQKRREALVVVRAFSSSEEAESDDGKEEKSDSSSRGGRKVLAALVSATTTAAVASAPFTTSFNAVALAEEGDSAVVAESMVTESTTPENVSSSVEAPSPSVIAEEPSSKPAFTLNMDLDTSAYDAMTRTGGNSDKAKALVNKGVPSKAPKSKDQGNGGGFNLFGGGDSKKKEEKKPAKKAEKPKKAPTPKMASPLESKAKEEDGFNPIVIVAPLALGGFAFGASKLIGGPLVERREEEEEQPKTQIMKKPKKVVEAKEEEKKAAPAFTPPNIEVPEMPNPFASMGGDPLPPDMPRKSFPKRSEASFNFIEEDESISSGEIDDALDESYEEDQGAAEREMEREMREAERERKRAEAEARREEKKLEAAQRREEQRAEQEEKRRQQEMIREQKQAEAAERKEEQARTRALKAEEAAAQRAQRRAEMEAKAAAAKEARTQRKSVSVKKASEPESEGKNFLSALTEMRKPAAATQVVPAKTIAMQRKVKTFSNKSKSMAQKPSLALTQKVRPPNAVGGLPQGFPSVEDFEGLTQEEKLELCDKADAIVARLETRADAAEKFINSPVTSLLFFLKPGAEKNAAKARAQAEEAAAAARSLRSAASNPLGGAGAAVAAAVVGILGAGALLFGVLSSGGGSGAPSPAAKVNVKAPSPQTEQVRDIEAAEKMEAVKSGEASAEDVYAMFAK